MRQAILSSDWEAVRRIPSRLRGSYAVTMEGGGARGTWNFRTHHRPSFGWPEADTIKTTSNLLASPHVFGYRLVGFGAQARDDLVVSDPSGLGKLPLVWLAAADRPTVTGNDARQVLRGELEFKMGVAPPQLWDVLEVFVPPLSPRDSLVLRRMPEIYARENRQPRLPITIRLDSPDSVRADTTLTRNGKTLRISLARLDTISVDSRF